MLSYSNTEGSSASAFTTASWFWNIEYNGHNDVNICENIKRLKRVRTEFRPGPYVPQLVLLSFYSLAKKNS